MLKAKSRSLFDNIFYYWTKLGILQCHNSVECFTSLKETDMFWDSTADFIILWLNSCQIFKNLFFSFSHFLLSCNKILLKAYAYKVLLRSIWVKQVTPEKQYHI